MSGRVEETARPTALALANGINATICINAVEKQRVLQALRERKPHWSGTLINVHIFSTLLYLLLKDPIQKLELAIIDPEYQGYETPD